MAKSAKKKASGKPEASTPEEISPSLEEELGATIATDQELSEIRKLAAKGIELQRTIDGLEETLAAHKAELHTLTTRQLPDALSQVGMKNFETDDGAKIEVKDFLSGGISKNEEVRKKQLSWLIKNGAEDIIKKTFLTALPRGEKKVAELVKKAFEKLKIDYVEKEDVNTNTFHAFLRERMKAGKKVPLELLGIYAGRAAKITLPPDVKERRG